MINPKKIFYICLPGILTAMTGVGVGDLATAGFTGANLGTAILWAILIGAFFKFALSTGFTRWQLSTKTTILHGCIEHLRIPFILFFILYFFPWCLFVGGALISASGVTASAILYQTLGTHVSKNILGIPQSLLAVTIILLGHFKIFSKIMSFCAIILFISVFYCVSFVPMNFKEILSGLFIPTIPQFYSGGLLWTIALMGGVGGTLTIICYGYWIAEEKRIDMSSFTTCKIDLGIGYLLTALFGIAMIIIGSVAANEAKGLGLLIDIAAYFKLHIGKGTDILFLLGAWGAIFSSLLGVWQCVPQIFSDCINSLFYKQDKSLKELRKTKYYRVYLWILAIVPSILLYAKFKDIQKIYSFVGAFFIPLLALSLLYLNNNKQIIKNRADRNSFIFNILLVVILIFFSITGFITIKHIFNL
jgi:Mn2+/Fe2+ NRAMP family transporter